MTSAALVAGPTPFGTRSRRTHPPQTVARHTDAMPTARMITRPYSPGTEWSWSSRRSSHAWTEELVLYAEPDGSSMSDDYLPEEADAQELWRKWVDRYAVTYHERYPDEYRLGEVPIFWSVTRPSVTGVFEAAPYTTNGLGQDFLTHYTHPVHAKSGERLNFARLPVLDLGWNKTAADKGGFIQEATGWKPSALQRTMNYLDIGRAAGLYVP